MFREQGIHSVSVRLGWWFYNFVFCVGLTLRGDTISLYSVCRIDLDGIAIAKEPWGILAK